ncbi:LEA type 2 family protein [Bdellovibrio sp. HCB2-146]|uniref:LEA type 2 family protein n=1 Tax=Bdellovibrio sp. HCB2-146 TaxID=3394362 RepID=UPI0039BD6356
MRARLYAAILIVSAFFTAGCASNLLNLEKPKVDLQSVYAKDATASGTTLVFVVNVDNPNNQEIKVKEIAYKVFVSGKELSDAKTEKPIVVPAHKSELVEIPLPVSYANILNNIAEVLFNKEVTYKIQGTAKLSFVSIPFTKEGKVELR